MKVFAGIAVATVIAVSAAAMTAQGGGTASAPVVKDGDWPNYNRDLAATRFSPLKQITTENVGSLKQAWAAQLPAGTQVPVVINGVMYATAGPRVVALDGDTGKEIWSYTIPPVPRPSPTTAAPGVPPPAVAGSQAAPVAAPGGPAAAPGSAANPAAPAPAGQGGGDAAPAAGGGRGAGRGGRGGGAVGGAQAPGGGAARGPNASTRGVGYWPGDGTLGPRILFMAGTGLFALDAATGTPAAGFGDDGRVSVTPGYGGTPTVYRNVAIIGAATLEVPQGDPGNPRAFDVRTGKKLWEFQTVPQPGEKFNETWRDVADERIAPGRGWYKRGGTNMWAFSASIDAERGLVYLPIAGPAANYYGGDRPGNNVYANSIVAVDAETGAYKWHFQTVHHDLWDTDMPAAGGLVTVRVNGRAIPAIAQVGKSSYMYILDRTTGKPVFGVEEKRVPKGDVPTEWYSPTQPIPVKPRPLSRVSFKPEDIVTAADTTPEHAAACKAMYDASGGYRNDGPFTPFYFKEKDAPPKSTIQFPGGIGGVNWGGVAVDPTTGYVFAQAHDTSLVGWIEVKDDGNYSFDAPGSTQAYDRAALTLRADGQWTVTKGPFASFNAPVNGKSGVALPCQKGPWAKLVAVNANTGEIAWESVLGLNESLPDGKQLSGNAGSAGPTVTAGGLVFVGAANDRRFRAFDAKTGKEVWTMPISGNANANPMSYQGKSGKQYVAIAAGNNLLAFALP
jgi:glucose dehydrogenase